MSKKRRAWTVCKFKRRGGGGLARKKRGVFLRGFDTPMHTMRILMEDDQNFKMFEGTFYLLFAQDLKKQIICDTKQYFLKHLLEK